MERTRFSWAQMYWELFLARRLYHWMGLRRYRCTVISLFVAGEELCITWIFLSITDPFLTSITEALFLPTKFYTMAESTYRISYYSYLCSISCLSSLWFMVCDIFGIVFLLWVDLFGSLKFSNFKPVVMALEIQTHAHELYRSKHVMGQDYLHEVTSVLHSEVGSQGIQSLYEKCAILFYFSLLKFTKLSQIHKSYWHRYECATSIKNYSSGFLWTRTILRTFKGRQKFVW